MRGSGLWLKTCARPSRYHQMTASFLLFFIVLTFATPSVSQAENALKITRITDYQNNQQLFMDSETLFHLPDAVIDAINHEITIAFTTEIELLESYSILNIPLTRTRQSFSYQTRLHAHGFNRHYELHNTRNQKSQRFTTLNNALETLGTLQDFAVIHLSELHPDQRYILRMRISLNRWQLPAPLLLESLVNPDWQLTTGWYEQIIQTPKSWL